MRESDWEILSKLRRTPNLTKVANLLYMTQPSLTKRIKNIEIELDTVICERTPKGLTFTPEGEYLCKCADEQLEYMKRVRKTLDEMKGNSTASIKIGSAYTYSKYFLNDLLMGYTKDHPNAKFEVINASSGTLYQKLLEGEVDVGFLSGDYDGPIYRTLAATYRAYTVTKEPLKKIEDLQNMKKIGYTTNDKTIELLESWWTDQFGFRRHPEITVGYIDFTWKMVNQGIGYIQCFLPDCYENPYNLYMTPMLRKDGSPITRNTWCTYSMEKRKSQQLSDFIDYVEKELK